MTTIEDRAGIAAPAVNNYAYQLGKICSFAFHVRNEAMNPDAPKTTFGPRAEMIKTALRTTRTAGIALRSLLPDHESLIGTGAHSLVFATPDNSVEKRIYRPQPNLSEELERREEAYFLLAKQFGHLVMPTEYGVGELRMRPIRTAMQTVQSTQRQVVNPIDVFSDRGEEIVGDPTNERVRDEVGMLVGKAVDWREKDMWLDLSGIGNTVLERSDGEWALRVVDVEPLQNVDLDIVNPVDGTTPRQRTLERTELLMQITGL